MTLARKIYENPHRFGWLLGYTKLSDIHSDWIKYIWKTKEDRTIQAFRGSYKTTAICVVGIMWYLFFNPDNRVLICREELFGAAATVGEIIKQYKSQAVIELYDKVYGIKDFTLSSANTSSLTLPTKERITKEGSVEATGVGGAITGRHYEKILTDDIVTLRDRVSKAKREEVKNFVRELKNIAGGGGTVCHSGTPWHKEDAFSILPEAKKYPIGEVQVADLTPERIEDIKKRTTPSLWAANYLLKHIADDQRIFVEPKYSDWNLAESPQAYLDPAYKGDHTTALSIGYTVENRVICTGFVWRKDITELYGEISTILKRFRVSKLTIESNADKGLSVTEMQKYFPFTYGYHESTNKHAKIVAYCKKHWNELYFIHGCSDEYVSQILDYCEGQEPDDAVDSLASLIREIAYNAVLEAKVY